MNGHPTSIVRSDPSAESASSLLSGQAVSIRREWRKEPKRESRATSSMRMTTPELSHVPARCRNHAENASASCHACEELRWMCWAAEQSIESVLITDRDGVIQFVNDAFEAMTGYASGEVVGRRPSILRSGQHDAHFYEQLWTTVLAGQTFAGVFVNRRRDGELYHEEKTIRPFHDHDGEITHYVSTGRDVSTRMREIARLERLARYDGLTGLANHDLFAQRLREANTVAANTCKGFTLMYVDVDDFKSINDSLGHDAGDSMLQVVGARLAHAVEGNGSVARLSGDEFAVILPDNDDHPSVVAVLERIFGSFAVPVPFGDAHVPLSVSVGVHICMGRQHDERELLRRADQAMYKAKSSGGRRYAFSVADGTDGNGGPV